MLEGMLRKERKKGVLSDQVIRNCGPQILNPTSPDSTSLANLTQFDGKQPLISKLRGMPSA
jgi:hypothetical protein